ncbi:MAG: CdvA-like protein, partial [Candidatus Bathyarchaeia archaeon]
MSLWKYSFELIMRDLELTKKKKQALDELFTSKKISESTYEYLEKELNETLIDLQNHLKSLTDKMTARSEELEKQKCTLELFLASAEIHHAAGEIDNEAYEAQTKAILLGLDYTKQELN